MTPPPDAPNTKQGQVYVPCRSCNAPPYYKPLQRDCGVCGGFGYLYAKKLNQKGKRDS